MGKASTTTECYNKCKSKGYLYMGRQGFNSCYCGNKYGQSGEASFLCNSVTCALQSSFYGSNVNCVFEINPKSMCPNGQDHWRMHVTNSKVHVQYTEAWVGDISSDAEVEVWHEATNKFLDGGVEYYYSKCLPPKNYKITINYYSHSDNDRPVMVVYRNDEIVMYRLGYFRDDNKYWIHTRDVLAICSLGQDLSKISATPGIIHKSATLWKLKDVSNKVFVWQSYYSYFGVGGIKHHFFKCLDPFDYKIFGYYYAEREDDLAYWEVYRNGVQLMSTKGYFDGTSGYFYTKQTFYAISSQPSSVSSYFPSEEPSFVPSHLPSAKPSFSPSLEPSSSPSVEPYQLFELSTNGATIVKVSMHPGVQNLIVSNDDDKLYAKKSLNRCEDKWFIRKN